MLKVADSISAKLNQLKATTQELYTSMGVESLIKGFLDGLTSVIERLNDMGKLGKFPAQALITIGSLIKAIKVLLINGIKSVSKNISKNKLKISTNVEDVKKEFNQLVQKREAIIEAKLVGDDRVAARLNQLTGQNTIPSNTEFYGGLTPEEDKAYVKKAGRRQVTLEGVDLSRDAVIELNKINNKTSAEAFVKKYSAQLAKGNINNIDDFRNASVRKLTEKEFAKISGTKEISKGFGNWISQHKMGLAQIFNFLGTITTILGTATDLLEPNSRSNVEGNKIATGLGQGFSGVGSALTAFALSGGNPLALLAGIPEVINGIASLIDGIWITTDERIDMLNEELQEAETKSLQSRAEANDMDSMIKKYERLKETQYNSEEDYQAFIDFQNELGAKHIDLVDYYDAEGNAIVDLNEAYGTLLKLRHQEATDKLTEIQTERRKNRLLMEEYEGIKFLLEGPVSFSKASEKEGFKERFHFLQNEYSNRHNLKEGSDLEVLTDAIESLGSEEKSYGDNLVNSFIQSYFPEYVENPKGLIADLEKYQEPKKISYEELSNISKLSEEEFIQLYGFNTENFWTQLRGKLGDSFFSEIGIDDRDSFIKNASSGVSETIAAIKLINNGYLDISRREDILSRDEGRQQAKIRLADASDKFNTNVKALEFTESSYANVLAQNAELSSDEIYNYYVKLSEEQRKALEEVLNHPENYGTISEWKEAMRSASGNEEISFQINDYIDTVWKHFLQGQGEFKTKIIQAMDGIENIEYDSLTRGSFNEKEMSLIFDQWGALVVEKFNNGLTTQAQFYGDKLNELYKIGDNDPELMSIVLGADLTSREGITSAREAAEKAGVDNSALEIFDDMLADLFLNANTAVETYIAKIDKTTEEVKKAGELYTKGTTDLSEMTNIRTLLSQAGFEGTAFEYNEIQEAFTFTREAYQKRYEIQQEEINKLETDAKAVLDNAELISNSLFNEDSSGWNDDDIKRNISELAEEAVSENNIALSNAYEAIEKQWEAFKSSNAEATWGDFIKQYNEEIRKLAESLELSANEKDQLISLYSPTRTAENIVTLSEALAEKGIRTTSKDILSNKNLSLNEQENALKIIENTENIWLDVLTAGQNATELQIIEWGKSLGLKDGEFDRFSSYIKKGLSIEKIAEEFRLPLDKSSQKFVDAYNSNLIEDAESITNSAIGLLKMGKDQRISDELITKLQGKYGDEFVQAILSQFSTFSHEFDGKKLDLAAKFKANIKDLNLQTEGQAIINSFASYISSAIEGSLKPEEAQDLIEQFDLDAETYFTNGEKGLRISLSTANELYNEMLKIDKIAAGTIMDSMVEEYKSWYDGSMDVSTVLSKIQETREKISAEEGKPDTTKKEQYEAELAVLNQIYARRTEEDFAFMNRDLGDLNQPLTYWENASQAAGAMQEAANTGYMGAQDFTRIMTHTQEMLIAAGMDTELAGKECSQLMAEGFRAMTMVDGQLVIPMESLGQNFIKGADGMYANFQDGIQTMAKSQIELLDAQIAMLEAVVAMEEMDFSGGDSIGIDRLDFFGTDAEGNWGFTENWDTNAKEIVEKLEQTGIDIKNDIVLIGDKAVSIADLFSEESLQELGLLNDETFQQNYALFMEKLYSFIEENGQFDVEGFRTWWLEYQANLQADKTVIENLTQGSSVNINIGGTEYKITQEEDGGYNFDGVHYDTQDQVLAAIAEKREQAEKEKVTSQAENGEIELPMKVALVPNVEYIVKPGKITNDPSAEAFDYLQHELQNGNSTLGKVFSADQVATEVPYTLTYNVVTNTDSVPEYIFKIIENNGGEYTLSFKSSETNAETLALIEQQLNQIAESANESFEIDTSAIESIQTIFASVIAQLQTIAGLTNFDFTVTTTTNGQTDEGGGQTYSAGGQVTFNNSYSAFAEQVNSVKFDPALAGWNAFETDINNTNFNKANTAFSRLRNTVTAIITAINGMPTSNAGAYAINKVSSAIRAIPSYKPITVNLKVISGGDALYDGNIIGGGGSGWIGDGTGGELPRLPDPSTGANAKGNVAFAKGTLMGELGPELVVSNGRYFVVGQYGAEFVNLADDAIVFNHLQTEQLLNNGSTSRGKPKKNEKTSVAFASGNVEGPAMASASETLAQLYQLRAMWQAMLDWSTKDLASMAGTGGGGGGGGGGGEAEDKTAFLADLERYYNLLRQIAKWEEKITLEQARRQNMLSGYDYVNSLERELDMLKKQEKAHRELADARGDYYKQLRNDFLGTEFAKIFTYDQDGLMQYKAGGFELLQEALATDANGVGKHTAEEQIKILEAGGINMSSFRINDDMSKAETDEQILQNFFDREAKVREEMDAAYDSYHEELVAIEETVASQTEIEQEYIDTQLSFEEKLMQAVEDRAQAEIDALEEEKTALEEASQAYIDGLSDALSNEREMYSKNQTQQETEQLQRRLAILQRSGGSQTEINSLREQIDSRLKDSYFTAAQEEIDGIQKASDAQIERMDNQINIMTEALEYQKENGLLWQEVYSMMQEWTPERLVDFITAYTKSYQENSPLQNQEDSKQALKEAEILEGKQRRERGEQMWDSYYSSNKDSFSGLSAEELDKVKQAYIEDIVGGGSGISAATTEKRKILAQKALDQSAESAGGSSGGTSDETKPTAKGGPKKNIPFLVSNSTEVYESPRKSSKIISYMNAGPADIVEYDPATGWFTIKNWTNQVGKRVGNKTGYYKVHSDKENFKNYTSALKKYLSQFKSGGLIDFTGPAWVDGSKSKPESILSADDTAAMLQLRGQWRSILEATKVIEGMDWIYETSRKALAAMTNTENQSVNFENVAINLQSGVISSDYDARQAVNVIKTELLSLARKTTGVSLNRR